MASVASSSSSSSERGSRATSSSDADDTTKRERNLSETSREVSQIAANARPGSATNTIDATSLAETATQRTASPATSVATTVKSGTTNATLTSQTQQPMPGSIPIIRPPILQQQSSTNSASSAQSKPTGYPTNPPQVQGGGAYQNPIKIDVNAAQQQYQQRGGQPDVSPYSGSTVSSSGESLSSPGSTSTQQQPVSSNVGNPTVNQANLRTQNNFNQAGGQFNQQRQQQPQFPNQIPASQVYNELLGPDAFKDVILDIDYGALGGFNAVFQSGADLAGGQLPPGISVRPAYTTVDSLSYQQHMFNTARNINAGSETNNYDYSGMSGNYDMGGTSNAYHAGGGQHFDIAKAIFNQADTNRDGVISRDEFQHWAQGGQQNYGGQSYSTTANYQTAGTNYANNNNNNNFYQASLFDGASADVASILQQSGLGQIVPN